MDLSEKTPVAGRVGAFTLCLVLGNNQRAKSSQHFTLFQTVWHFHTLRSVLQSVSSRAFLRLKLRGFATCVFKETQRESKEKGQTILRGSCCTFVLLLSAALGGLICVKLAAGELTMWESLSYLHLEGVEETSFILVALPAIQLERRRHVHSNFLPALMQKHRR